MTKEELIKELQLAINDQMRIGIEVEASDTIEDLQLDELDLLHVVLQLEAKFGFDVDETVLKVKGTISDLADAIMAQIAPAAEAPVAEATA